MDTTYPSKDYLRSIFWIVPTVLALWTLSACQDARRPRASDIAVSPEQLSEKLKDNLGELLRYAKENHGEIGDSVFLYDDSLVRYAYEKNYSIAFWSGRESWKPFADSFLHFLAESRYYGLFPADYHYPLLDSINRRFQSDSAGNGDRRDAALWSRADLLMTDAFLRVVRDVKLGRLPKDSITLRKDSALAGEYYLRAMNALKQSGSITRVIQDMEPRHAGYQLLKQGLKLFLDSADYREYTPVPMPGKDQAAFRRALQTRLYESGYLDSDSIAVDSATLSQAIRRFQKRQQLTVDGKAGPGTVKMLNMSDREKFVRIAINLDKYKMLPDTMPNRYIWVNLPGYYMKLVEGDTVRLLSKVICGKPLTRTPLLTSAIYNIVTYPQWTMPTSIIVKEVLPGIRRDSAYFRKKGYSLVDDHGNEVDPATVDWSKYHKGIPYKVVQGSGDDNALGVLKFNFNNKYAVYLHDTNQRYLFAQSTRSLSHGCVRVQEWQKLAYDILHHEDTDSLKVAVKIDSLNSWLSRKVKKTLPIRNKLPVFFRYFTCEGNGSGVTFYDDMYGEDKLIREKYFAGRQAF